MKKIFGIFILLISYSAVALENPYLLRSPRGLLMGDAFTAVNDDEFTLLYNPASLGRHRHDFSISPVNPTVSATNLLSDLDKFENFPDTPQGAADVIMDYPIHAGANIAPGFKFFNVGVTFIANEQIDAVLKNRTHPMLDLDLRQDKGVMVGFAIPLTPNRLSKKTFGGSQTSLGIGAKYIQRKGVADSYALTGTTVMDTLGQDEVNDILRSLGTVKGQTWGFDAGIEHVARSGNSQFVLGLAALDIGNTEFKIDENPEKRKVADIRSQFNLGMSFGQDFKAFHYILSADVRGLNEQRDFMHRVRLGAEIGFPVLSLMAGVNSGYYSYGATVKLGIMKITAGFYDLEVGSSYKQTKSRQALLYLSLFDFSFDA